MTGAVERAADARAVGAAVALFALAAAVGIARAVPRASTRTRDLITRDACPVGGARAYAISAARAAGRAAAHEEWLREDAWTHASLAMLAGEATLARARGAEAPPTPLATAALEHVAAMVRDGAVDATPPRLARAVAGRQAATVRGIAPTVALRLAAVAPVPARVARALKRQPMLPRLGGGAR